MWTATYPAPALDQPIGERQPVPAPIEHVNELHLHGRERREASTQARAQQRPAVARERKPLLQSGHEVPDKERAQDVHRKRWPWPLSGRLRERRCQGGSRESTQSASREDRADLAAIGPSHHSTVTCGPTDPAHQAPSSTRRLRRLAAGPIAPAALPTADPSRGKAGGHFNGTEIAWLAGCSRRLIADRALCGRSIPLRGRLGMIEVRAQSERGDAGGGSTLGTLSRLTSARSPVRAPRHASRR